MLNTLFFGWEFSWELESKNGQEEHWSVVRELINVLEKIFIDFG